MLPTHLAPQAPAAPAAASYAADYLDRLDGDAPLNLADFLDGVPEDLREPVFQEIDRALANRGAEDEHLYPAAEVTLARHERRDAWLRIAGLIVPYTIRHAFVGELRAHRQELRAAGKPDWWIRLVTTRELAEGVAQHAPLDTPAPTPDAAPVFARRFALAGRHAWRAAGPLLLLGVLFGGAVLWTLGGVLAGVAFAALIYVVAARRDPYTANEVRLANAVLGGTVVIMTSAAAAGLICLCVIGAAALLGATWLSAAAVQAVALVATGVAALVTGSGWTPLPWLERRLIRV